ncbi:MAG: hypothetical protein DRQ55_09465 [Planctomycetota bacterium]|nr:MAG: hypothetical protein DRQ55_09465 [Planctomycetota bacterium]
MAVGHDIRKAYMLVQQAGLLTPPLEADLEQFVIEWLSSLWKARIVPYIRQGAYREPQATPVLDVVERIVRETKRYCYENRERHRIRLNESGDPVPSEVIDGHGCGCPVPDENCER